MLNLTYVQKEELKVLNQRLLKLQEKILKEAVKLDTKLAKRVKNKTDLLDDYEIEFELTFILKNSDEKFNSNDDNFLTSISEYLKGISENKNDFLWSLEENHNDLHQSHPMSDFSHSWWFHCLYDHNHLSWEDMLRIGDFWSDLKISYQYFD